MKSTILMILLFSFQSVLAFDTWWHAECTRKGMTANGFSNDARLAVQVSNYITDFNTVSMPYMEATILEKGNFGAYLGRSKAYEYMHFDAVFSTKDIASNWYILYKNTVNLLKSSYINKSIKEGYREIVLFNILGASLHMVQDFYSHSNWVHPNGMNAVNPIVSTWYEADSVSKMKLNIYTGVYPDGSQEGKANHGDLHKDNSARSYNDVAVFLAEKASTEWIKKIIDATPALPWAALKKYSVQKNMVMKDFLENLDANFLTTSSILAGPSGHFDGENPKKTIFSKDLIKEKFSAGIVLKTVISQYAINWGLQGLFSPYWAGFTKYDIINNLAIGLLHNGVTYVEDVNH